MASADHNLLEAELLRLVRQRLLSSGVEVVADIALEDGHLMTRDRRLAITTAVRDVAEGKLHAHVISWLPNRTAPNGKDTLDACILGFGATMAEATTQVAEVWL